MHTQKKEYFDFSYHDIGLKDIPAMIDMILEKTKVAKLTYIGHSQGTTAMFYALAKNQDLLKSKINLFVALAPAT